MTVNAGPVREMKNTSLVSWKQECCWTLGVTLLGHVCNDTVRARMKVAPIVKKIHEKRLRWYGHVAGKRPRERWVDKIRADLKELRIDEHHALDREYWRQLTRTADPV
ncbi:unnamed protein product [Strongylus vulgaris]|uniref:Reverse transcriptase domain-containing protein n=1 Tax=Strongylus vulgaris TaxID=40348 RepID=A0A3P7JIX1_STRVU|nr:unnamed protein product [Strongylus vulgaris]